MSTTLELLTDECWRTDFLLMVAKATVDWYNERVGSDEYDARANAFAYLNLLKCTDAKDAAYAALRAHTAAGRGDDHVPSA